MFPKTLLSEGRLGPPPLLPLSLNLTLTHKSVSVLDETREVHVVLDKTGGFREGMIMILFRTGSNHFHAQRK